MSVIVPVYGQLPLVIQLCQSIMRNPQPSLREVILVDDASPDFELTRLIGAPMTVIRNPTNMGYVATANVGAKAATGNLFLFLNSDIEVTGNWLEPMVRLFTGVANGATGKPIGIVAPKLVFPPNEQGEALIQSAGGWYDGNKSPFHRYMGWRADAPQVNKTEKVSWVTGAALLTPRSVFAQVGGFDEAYGRGYFDDPDYAERVKQAGYEVWYCPESVMIHKTGQSMNAAAKTEAQQKAAAKSFRENAWRFHERFDSVITPDTPLQWVAY